MLAGKVMLVTGGTGSIGEAIVRSGHAYGARVVFTYHRSRAKATALARVVKGAKALCVDLSSAADIQAKLAEDATLAEGVDILVNNAGTSQIMPLSLMEAEDVDAMLDVNVRGALLVTKEVVRHMIRARRGGAIVNIGSIAGHRLLDVPVHYAAAKAALAGATRALAAELKRYGIRANCVVPGLIEGGVSEGIPEALRQDFCAHCALGRPGRPAEVAEVVCFLASARASYVNAQCLQVDGGI